MEQHAFFRGTAPDNDIQRKIILGKILLKLPEFLAILCSSYGVIVFYCVVWLLYWYFYFLWVVVLAALHWGTVPVSPCGVALWGYCGPLWPTRMWNYDLKNYFICTLNLKLMLFVQPEKEESQQHALKNANNCLNVTG
jgi:hypothetical protein